MKTAMDDGEEERWMVSDEMEGKVVWEMDERVKRRINA